MVRAAAKADSKEDDLFALAEKGGPDAKEGLPVGTVLLGSDGLRGIDEKGDPGFKTRVKAPDDKTAAKPAAAKLPRGSAAEKTAADIAENLEEKFAVIFSLLTNALPVTGVYGVENSPKAVRALMDIGKRRPVVMRVLMKIADGADGMEIGKFLAGLAIAVQVDLGKMQGDELFAKTVGVTEVLEKYFLNTEEAPNENVTVQATHARFQPVV
jgi:hypothetical protein